MNTDPSPSLRHTRESVPSRPRASLKASPSSKHLTGYNHNFRHRKAVFHVQTEDAGPTRGYVVTHLFAEGGWVIGTVKTDYKYLLDTNAWTEELRDLMKTQHKAMALALRDGDFDAVIDSGPASKRMPIDQASVPSHEVEEGKLRATQRPPRSEPPPPPDCSQFAGITLLLDRVAAGVGAAVVDLDSGIAVSLRDEGCPEGTGERVSALADLKSETDGPEWREIIVVMHEVAFAILRRHSFVVFLYTSLEGRLAVQRFRVQVRQVAAFLCEQEGVTP